MKDAQFIGSMTSMAALRKTDVHAFAQCSQLFPSPSEYCCADSQILTHPATAFEEYSPPSPSYSLRRKKNKLLESTYFNQSAPRVLLQIRASAITSPIIIFILFTRVPSEALRRNARWKLHRQSSDKRKSSPGPKSCFLLCSCITCKKQGSHKPY